jgi:hypothetical protein
LTEDDTTPHSIQPEIVVRAASAHDLDAIATLHADSWRRHYREAYRDEFLDVDVVADRLKQQVRRSPSSR